MLVWVPKPNVCTYPNSIPEKFKFGVFDVLKCRRENEETDEENEEPRHDGPCTHYFQRFGRK
jgi:hypothetical protein